MSMPKQSPEGRSKKVRARLPFAEVMATLEAAGSAQTRKTYARHRVEGPMFGVSFATLKVLMKQIDVDHELALQLWETGNFDARNLAVKIVDPDRMGSADLDRWVRETSTSRMCGGYVPMLAAEGPLGEAKVVQWLASAEARDRCAAWSLLGQLTQRDEVLPDSFFEAIVAEIERTIHAAPNDERPGMNGAVIAIGCRSPGLRAAALAAAKRIGTVDIDHGDTDCKTPDAALYIEKAWAYSTLKGFASPAAQERKREAPRRRC